MKNNITNAALFSAFIFCAAIWIAAAKTDKRQNYMPAKNMEGQPEELGKVKWLRNIEAAQRLSKKGQKPILILFQEVPGCATCRNYGNNILSHPLIVEAIESEFVPLAIFNNKKGSDAEVLNYFNEPAWNNPVVRIVNADKRDVTARLGGNYTAFGLVNSMLLALGASNRVAPKYLELLGAELQAKALGTEQANIAMHCFWTGEKEIGEIPGVVATEAGFMGGREVVRVEYCPAVVSFSELISEAKKSGCASHVFAEGEQQKKAAGKVVGSGAVSEKGKYRPDKEPKYYLSKTHWKYVPMTALQAVKANSLVGQRKPPEGVLSPRQVELAEYILRNKNLDWEDVIGVELGVAWGLVEKVKKRS